MIKRFRAWILAIMLLATSGGLAQAESPKGEAYKTNKTNIETQAPVESASNENEIVKVNEATKEEVIVAQEDSEEAEALEELQLICSKIDDVAFELNEGEIHQMTPVEYRQRYNEIIKAANKEARFNNLEASITAYLNVVAFEALPDNIKVKTINDFNRDANKITNDFAVGSMIASTIISSNSDVSKLFCSSENQEELIQMFDKICGKLANELQAGKINGSKLKTFYEVFRYAQNKMKSHGILSHIITYYGNMAFVKLHYVASELDDYGEYFDGWGVVKNQNKLPKNPKNEVEQFFKIFADVGNTLDDYLYNPGIVLENQVDFQK